MTVRKFLTNDGMVGRGKFRGKLRLVRVRWPTYGQGRSIAGKGWSGWHSNDAGASLVLNTDWVTGLQLPLLNQTPFLRNI